MYMSGRILRATLAENDPTTCYQKCR